MNKFLTVFFLPLFVYLALPTLMFPTPPTGSAQSTEPGDIQDDDVRAYFTNLSREEIISYYQDNYQLKALGFSLPKLRISDYPPEETTDKIREQVKSNFLEELVYPMRESIYISGFEPTDQKDQIIVAGMKFRNKITVKRNSSSLVYRELIALATLTGVTLLFRSLISPRRS